MRWILLAARPRVTLAVTCDGECEGVEASALAFRGRDAQPRSGGVGGRRSPADDTLTLHVQARDRGLGPERATAYLDGTAVDTAAFGDGRCADLSPGSSQIDLPLGLVGQNDVVDPATLEFTRIGCLGLGTAELSVDTTRVTDGRHTIVQKGRGTVARRHTATRARGRIDVRLKFERSRNVVFGVTAPNGRRDHGRLPARPKRSRKQLPLIAGLAGAHLRPGASVRVTVSKRGYRGIGKRYGIRDGQRVKARGYRLGGKRPRC